MRQVKGISARIEGVYFEYNTMFFVTLTDSVIILFPLPFAFFAFCILYFTVAFLFVPRILFSIFRISK